MHGGRVLAWAFAQGVLSAIWSVEDGEEVTATHPGLLLTRAIVPLLDAEAAGPWAPASDSVALGVHRVRCRFPQDRLTHLAAPQVSIEPYWVSIEAVRMAIQVDRGTIEVVLVVIALPSLSTKLDICPIESGHLIGDIRQSFREVFGV